MKYTNNEKLLKSYGSGKYTLLDPDIYRKVQSLPLSGEEKEQLLRELAALEPSDRKDMLKKIVEESD